MDTIIENGIKVLQCATSGCNKPASATLTMKSSDGYTHIAHFCSNCLLVRKLQHEAGITNAVQEEYQNA